MLCMKTACLRAVTERVTSEQSAARQALFGGEATGVKKPRRRAKGQKTHDQKTAARRARERDEAGD